MSVRISTSPEHSFDAFLRARAGQLIDWAICAELEEFLLRFAAIKDARGRPAIVRNGYQPTRLMITNLGPVPVRVPKVRSRTGQAAVFHSSIARPYMRRIRCTSAEGAWLFLEALANGQLQAAVAAALGQEAAAMRAPVLQRMAKRWRTELEPWLTGPLSGGRCKALRLELLQTSHNPRVILSALGIDDQAHEHLLAAADGAAESADGWRNILSGLRQRGLALPAELQIGYGVTAICDSLFTEIFSTIDAPA